MKPASGHRNLGLPNDGSFHAAYRDIEERMRALAEADGDVFLPNPQLKGKVDYILICMEPSLGRWARPVDEARSKVEAGFRNFLGSMEIAIVRFCAQRYLCKPSERYHITDLSKGAMLVNRAGSSRSERYDRWYPLLQEEIELTAAPNAGVIAVGRVVSNYLKRKGFGRSFIEVIHYSGQAGQARNNGIIGREHAFEAFENTVSLQDLITTMGDVLREARIPDVFRDEILSRLARRRLTTSYKKLMFNYKVAFESYAARRAPAEG